MRRAAYVHRLLHGTPRGLGSCRPGQPLAWAADPFLSERRGLESHLKQLTENTTLCMAHHLPDNSQRGGDPVEEVSDLSPAWFLLIHKGEFPLLPFKRSCKKKFPSLGGRGPLSSVSFRCWHLVPTSSQQPLLSHPSFTSWERSNETSRRTKHLLPRLLTRFDPELTG